MYFFKTDQIIGPRSTTKGWDWMRVGYLDHDPEKKNNGQPAPRNCTMQKQLIQLSDKTKDQVAVGAGPTTHNTAAAVPLTPLWMVPPFSEAGHAVDGLGANDSSRGPGSQQHSAAQDPACSHPPTSSVSNNHNCNAVARMPHNAAHVSRIVSLPNIRSAPQKLIGARSMDSSQLGVLQEAQSGVSPRIHRMSSAVYRMFGIESRRANKRAVVVGVNYRNSGNASLAGSVNDATLFALALINLFGFEPQNIMLLIDDVPSNCYRAEPSLPSVVDQARLPTRHNVLMGIQWLCNGTVAGDVLAFYFAGHGVQVDNMSGWEGEGYDEAIAPCDYYWGPEINALRATTLKELLLSVCKDVQVTIVLDCNGGQTMLDPAGTGGWWYIKGLKTKGFWPFLTDSTNKVERARYQSSVWRDPSMRLRDTRPRFLPGCEVSNTDGLADPCLEKPRIESLHGNTKGYMLAAAPWGQCSAEAILPAITVEALSENGASLVALNPSAKHMEVNHGVFTWCLISALTQFRRSEVAKSVNRSVCHISYRRLLSEVHKFIRICKDRYGLSKVDQLPELTLFAGGNAESSHNAFVSHLVDNNSSGGRPGPTQTASAENRKMTSPTTGGPVFPQENSYLTPLMAENRMHLVNIQRQRDDFSWAQEHRMYETGRSSGRQRSGRRHHHSKLKVLADPHSSEEAQSPPSTQPKMSTAASKSPVSLSASPPTKPAAVNSSPSVATTPTPANDINGGGEQPLMAAPNTWIREPTATTTTTAKPPPRKSAGEAPASPDLHPLKLGSRALRVTPSSCSSSSRAAVTAASAPSPGSANRLWNVSQQQQQAMSAVAPSHHHRFRMESLPPTMSTPAESRITVGSWHERQLPRAKLTQNTANAAKRPDAGTVNAAAAAAVSGQLFSALLEESAAEERATGSPTPPDLLPPLNPKHHGSSDNNTDVDVGDYIRTRPSSSSLASGLTKKRVISAADYHLLMSPLNSPRTSSHASAAAMVAAVTTPSVNSSFRPSTHGGVHPTTTGCGDDANRIGGCGDDANRIGGCGDDANRRGGCGTTTPRKERKGHSLRHHYKNSWSTYTSPRKRSSRVVVSTAGEEKGTTSHDRFKVLTSSGHVGASRTTTTPPTARDNIMRRSGTYDQQHLNSGVARRVTGMDAIRRAMTAGDEGSRSRQGKPQHHEQERSVRKRRSHGGKESVSSSKLETPYSTSADHQHPTHYKLQQQQRCELATSPRTGPLLRSVMEGNEPLPEAAARRTSLNYRRVCSSPKKDRSHTRKNDASIAAAHVNRSAGRAEAPSRAGTTHRHVTQQSTRMPTSTKRGAAATATAAAYSEGESESRKHSRRSRRGHASSRKGNTGREERLSAAPARLAASPAPLRRGAEETTSRKGAKSKLYIRGGPMYRGGGNAQASAAPSSSSSAAAQPIAAAAAASVATATITGAEKAAAASRSSTAAAAAGGPPTDSNVITRIRTAGFQLASPRMSKGTRFSHRSGRNGRPPSSPSTELSYISTADTAAAANHHRHHPATTTTAAVATNQRPPSNGTYFY